MPIIWDHYLPGFLRGILSNFMDQIFIEAYLSGYFDFQFKCINFIDGGFLRVF